VASVRFLHENVKNEARLTGSARSMQDRGWNYGESFELRAGQPLLSMRLFFVGVLGRHQNLSDSSPDPVDQSRSRSLNPFAPISIFTSRSFSVTDQ
jgi:hypothetical protein